MAQSDYSAQKEEYINKYKKLAIREMKRVGIPASIILAQGLLESSVGNHKLAREAKNHFRIKCSKNDKRRKGYRYWEEPVLYKKYRTVRQSYKDRSDEIVKRKRYSFLFDLEITDYRGWAIGLRKAGYDVHPDYDSIVIDIIEEYKLYLLDYSK